MQCIWTIFAKLPIVLYICLKPKKWTILQYHEKLSKFHKKDLYFCVLMCSQSLKLECFDWKFKKMNGFSIFQHVRYALTPFIDTQDMFKLQDHNVQNQKWNFVIQKWTTLPWFLECNQNCQEMNISPKKLNLTFMFNSCEKIDPNHIVILYSSKFKI